MKNLAGMLKQASQMQQKMEEMQAKLASMEVQGSAGAGMVSVTLNGKGEMRGILIDPKLVTDGDADMLQDLIIAAHADAKRKAESFSQEEMQKLTAGLPIPPGMKLPF
jgi:nucleoid-associated protein EbfC